MSGAPERRSHRRPRLLLPTERSDVTVTWHPERDSFILSMWHDEECVGSAPLTPQNSAELATFLVRQLADRSVWGPRLVVTESPPGKPLQWLGELFWRPLSRLVGRPSSVRASAEG